MAQQLELESAALRLTPGECSAIRRLGAHRYSRVTGGWYTPSAAKISKKLADSLVLKGLASAQGNALRLTGRGVHVCDTLAARK